MPEAISHSLLDPEKHAAVALDGLPRVARYLTTYDNGSAAETLHVLYWDGIVRSMEAERWPSPLPTDPTPEESAAAIAAKQQAALDATNAAAQLRQQVLATLQSTVGVRFADLTNAQLRAIVEVLAWQAGALKPDTTVRPPADWVR